MDEFIIGLPISSDGKETTQSNIVRSIAGRFAVRAAERWIIIYAWLVMYMDFDGQLFLACYIVTLGWSFLCNLAYHVPKVHYDYKKVNQRPYVDYWVHFKGLKE